jgi:hypothetical protein
VRMWECARRARSGRPMQERETLHLAQSRRCAARREGGADG